MIITMRTPLRTLGMKGDILSVMGASVKGPSIMSYRSDILTSFPGTGLGGRLATLMVFTTLFFISLISASREEETRVTAIRRKTVAIHRCHDYEHGKPQSSRVNVARSHDSKFTDDTVLLYTSNEH